MEEIQDLGEGTSAQVRNPPSPFLVMDFPKYIFNGFIRMLIISKNLIKKKKLP